MNNLRIVTTKKFVDTYNTGDKQSYELFEVRANFSEEEIKKWNYSKELIEKGKVIETFNSETNAEIFLNALKNTIK